MKEKRVTSFDVAKAAGVSRSVVSAVINGTPGIGVSQETREKVLRAIEELHYHVDAGARAMKTGVSRCIAAFGNMHNPLFLQVMEGMQKACAERGYQILISGKSSEDTDRYELLDLYRQRSIDGIITLDATSYGDAQWLEAIKLVRVPYISIEGYADTAGVTSILMNYRKSMTDALRFMRRSAGAKPIYIEAYLEGASTNWAERDRKDAYANWCKEHGELPEFYTMEAYDEAWAMRFLQKRLSVEEPLPPILINWSVSAVYLYRAAWRLGLTVGRDVLLMAGDDTNRGNAQMAPALSSVQVPYSLMGEAAVRELFDQMERSTRYKTKKLWLEGSIFPGESAILSKRDG
ncbi:LacI family DNA-binding transcriptional regulator [Paenibacillus sp. HB172176]|uniref:LacI family DNA-binding transcriptional regulator n=1 Tax=Paenibacillus sp. HB172176 TaxID=2493690 RepID=UPI001438AC04|nr:LacI family DNA-binding transcriptional regulator [Paenibacillus sp. HB172176]